MRPPAIRVLLAGLPDLLRAIVLDAARRAGDVHVVGEVGALDALPAPGAPGAAGGADPVHVADVVVAACAGGALPAPARRAMQAHARLAVLAIEPASGAAHLWRLRPHATALGQRSADELLRAVREGLRPAEGRP